MANPSTSDPFALLGLPRRFDLEEAAVEQAYMRELGRLHPDRFVGRPEAERTRALLDSVAVNDAYATVKDPMKRAAWLLRDAGMPVDGETGNVPASPELLKEVMEMREVLEEISGKAELEAFTAMLARNLKTLESMLASQFDAGNFTAAAQSAMRYKYLTGCLKDAMRRAQHHKTPC